MKLSVTFFIACLMTPLFLTGCGGGGGASSPTAPAAPVVQLTKVSGVASKGIFTSGTVNVYALAGGKRGALLKQAAITPFGTYSASLGSYQGPIVAEASGSYTDEATGTTLQVSADAPIRAALPLASGTVNLPVTALTEIAVQKTGGAFTPEAIAAANTVVSDLFKVDIINTRPVAATATALNSAAADQVTYTLALATISQLSASGSQPLATTLSALATSIDVASSSMTLATASLLQGALSAFTGNSHNQTGIVDPSTSPLANVGMRTVVVSVAVPGAALIGAVQGTIALPAGVVLDPGSPALAGTALGSILVTNPSPGSLTVGILSSNGFTAGEILTFSCSVASDRAVPAPADFTLSQVKVIGTTLAPLTANLALSVSAVTSATSSAGSSFSMTLALPSGISTIGGLQGTVTLPSGFTLNAGSTTLTGSAAGALLETNPGGSSFTFGVASGKGFGSGPFLTFTCTRAAAGGAPAPSDFAVSGIKVVDTSGATVSIPVTLSAS